MSKRFPWAGLLLIVALFIAGAAGAAEPPARLAPMAPQAASCLVSSSANAVAPVLPPWIEAGATLCGDGCPATGEGTDSGCRGKMTGTPCGVGGTCLLLLTPTCPRSAARCSCVTH
jgi:hypothetical protein